MKSDLRNMGTKDLENLINNGSNPGLNLILEWAPVLGLYFVPRNLSKFQNVTAGGALTLNAIYHAYMTFYLLPELAINYLN